MKKIFGLCGLITCLLLSTTAAAQQAETTNFTSATHQRYIYNVYYRSSEIGKLVREERRNGNNYYLSLSADLSFLFLNLGGYQNATAEWREEEKWFKPLVFDRLTTGLEDIKVKGSIDENSHSSQIEIDGKKLNFTSKKGKITELNSMFLQVKYGLLSGQEKFDFYMQTSDDVDHYFFEVKGKETLKTKFGELETYRLEQVKVKNRSLSVWFAPKLNMQMVKFKYHRKIVDISGELQSYYVK